MSRFKSQNLSLFSEEVFWSRFLSRYTTDVLRRCLEDFVISFVYFVKLKDSSDVTAAVAIVRSRPDCYKCFIKHFFVALHHKLMGAGNQLRTVLLIENLDSVLTENVAGTSW